MARSSDWRQVRDAIHAQVCAAGYDAQSNTFVQSYGSPHLDASLLLIPQVGFLPPDDPRVRGTVDAIERNLVVDGLVLRYSTATDVDALPPGEGTFLPCSFWLADSLVLTGRREEGEALFERLLALEQRPWIAVGGIRYARATHARKLSAGADAHGADQHGPSAVHSRGTGQTRQRERRAACRRDANIMKPQGRRT